MLCEECGQERGPGFYEFWNVKDRVFWGMEYIEINMSNLLKGIDYNRNVSIVTEEIGRLSYRAIDWARESYYDHRISNERWADIEEACIRVEEATKVMRWSPCTAPLVNQCMLDNFSIIRNLMN